jgi:hypothetical protein
MIPWAHGQPQIPIGADVRQTANFEASRRPSSESTGQWQTWGSGSETKLRIMTGEQRSLSAMPPKYELRWLAVLTTSSR